MPDAHTDQQRPLTTPGAFKQWTNACRESFYDGRFRDFAVFARRQPHVAGRNDGGNGVLVDHLAHAVSQQNDELIEGIDLSLQL